MNRLIRFLRIMILLATGAGAAPTCAEAAATEPYGLEAVTGFERLPFLKLDTLAGGQSSYDRSGGNADFSRYLRIEGSEKVLLDVTGPGTVYRIWFTGFDWSTDYIKIYFDGEATPRISLTLPDMLSGANAPFLTPLIGDNVVSSGGFYCYLPLPFSRSIKILSNATTTYFYYNIGYHLYSPDTPVTSWSGTEDSAAARAMWSNAGADPKSDTGNTVVSNTFILAAGATQSLLDVQGPRSISSIKLRFPGPAQPQPRTVTDNGRAHTGYSQFQVAIQPTNHGVTLVRRLDCGINNQTADVYVDGLLVGSWSDSGFDGLYAWRDSRFNIPPTFTTNKSAIEVTILFASSDLDWNEFYYWTYSLTPGATNLTDSLDIGDEASESSHQYTINTQTWSGSNTLQYAPVAVSNAAAAFDYLTNVWLRISFDHETTPSVFAPVGLFIALGMTTNYSTRSLPVGLDAASSLYCYFPMPFARRATVQLVSQRSIATTNVSFEIRHKPFVDEFTDAGYFKTDFRRHASKTNESDFTVLDVEGAGHLVGVVQSIRGPVNRFHLESDERIYVDDSRTPAVYGTGTEDFYNAGWYFNRGLFTLPLHGYTEHVFDDTSDLTTAYRLFIQDAIPFRKHLRAGIEDITGTSVVEEVQTLAYYYHQRRSRAVLTDQLDPGNVDSESVHSYSVSTQTWSGSQSYTYDGDSDSVALGDDGRAHRGVSRFSLSLDPANAGAILRRRLDQGVADQKAGVWVDGVEAGTWYCAGSNTFHRWRDDDFMIPAALTQGKSSVQIEIRFISSSDAWTEFSYSLLTLLPGTFTDFSAPAFAGFSTTTHAGSPAYGMTLHGIAGANYDIWTSTNLLDWTLLGPASELEPGLYNFTDTTTNGAGTRFYRASGH